MRTSIVPWPLVLVSLLAATPVSAAPYDSYAGFDLGYQFGDFDTANDETLYSISARLGAVGERFEASITFPYVFVESDEQGADNGPGDIVLRAGAELVEPRAQSWSLNASLAVKLPTADEQEGLGTGEADIGGFVTAARSFSQARLNLSLGYIETGDPPGIRYQDVVVYSIGVSRRFDRGNVFVSLDGRSNIDENEDDPQELHIGAFRVLDGANVVSADTFTGLNSGAADFGFTLGVLHWF